MTNTSTARSPASAPIKYTMWTSVKETLPLTQHLPWPNIVSQLTTFKTCDGDKSNEMLFSGVVFKGNQRLKQNATLVNMLVLDYDDGMTVDQAKQHFKQYEFVLYTSYNHQRVKDGKPPVDKFRIVFPLAQSINADTWELIHEHVEVFAPGVDPACKKITQHYTMPVVRTGQNGIAFHNVGEWLNIASWPQLDQSTLSFIGKANPVHRSEHKLKSNDTLETKNGLVRVGDINRRVSGVKCPFHGDNSPGEFANRSDKGNIYLHCKKCGTIFMEREDDAILTYALSRPQKIKITDKPAPTGPLYEIDQFVQPYDRDRRKAMLINKFDTLPKKYNLIYAAEGFGKSSLAIHKVKRGQKVIFCCNSNEQAVKQAEGFRDQGLSVQCVTSREYNLMRDHGVDAVIGPPPSPWEGGKTDEKRTKAAIAFRYPNISPTEVEQIWLSSGASDRPDFDNHEIVVTTHTRVRIWSIRAKRASEKQRMRDVVAAREARDDPQLHELRKTILAVDDDEQEEQYEAFTLPLNLIVFFDDPSFSDFCRLSPYEARFDKQDDDGNDILKKEMIAGRQYFVRPDQFIPAKLLACWVIFTTTEVVTRELIIATYKRDLYAPDGLVAEEKVRAGDIRVFATSHVHKKTDGLLTCIAERIKRTHVNVNYIADGQGSKLNLTNNKGRNDLTSSHSIIEISQPHQSEVIHLCDEVGWSSEHHMSMKVALALDRAHQAIGRNAGYRQTDAGDHSVIQCIVLIDPKLYTAFVNETRYFVVEHCNLDKLAESDSRFQAAITGLGTVRDAVVALVGEWKQYVSTEKYLQHDVSAAIKNCDPKKVEQLRSRVTSALTNLADMFKGQTIEQRLFKIVQSLDPKS